MTVQSATKKKKLKAIAVALAMLLIAIAGEVFSGCALEFGRISGYSGGVIVCRADEPAQYFMNIVMHGFILLTGIGMTLIYWKSSDKP